MKIKSLLLFVLLALACNVSAASLQNGVEYYIINDFYGKLLGSDEAGTGPALSAEGTNSNASSYIFIAETSNTSGYYYLKQKSTGRYLAASGSNHYGVVFENSKSTDTRFQWQITTGLKTKITNRKNTGARLGCDWNNTKFEGVYYDKGAGVMNFWSVIPVAGSSSHDYSNVRGTKERDYYALGNSNITLDTAIDLHIYREANPIEGGSINITNENAWVIFDNCTPTNVKNNYLSKIKINGSAAVIGSNVRIAIYLNGAAVIPCKNKETAFTGYTELKYGGNAVTYANGNQSDLGNSKNTIRSFKLRRGYMVTLATGTNGSGYSRVYVADHKDVEVDDLPEALDMRISSIHVKQWQYTGKKGFGGSSSTAYKLRCGWNYNWDANLTSSIDVEYIPIQQHRWWPSLSSVNGKEASTALLSINEPEHSEQHNGCSCGGTISSWNATTFTPDFQASGSRIGSPSPTDQNWLKEYFGHIDDMAYRCDFGVTHAYWGPNDANGTSGWNNRINSFYTDTKRPLWITEWEYGSSWYSDQSIYNGSVTDMAKKTIEILDALETNDHLERYAYYNTDGVWKLHCFYDEGGITPVGEAYRYVKSDFAYKAAQQRVPNYWTPGISKPSIKSMDLANGKYSIVVENKNGDFTKTLAVQAIDAQGNTRTLCEAERYVLDNASVTLTFDEGSCANAVAFKVVATNLANVTEESETCGKPAGPVPLAKLKNLSFNSGKYVDKGVLTYAKDVTTESPYSGMQDVEGWTININGDGRAAGLFAWGSTNAFGSTKYNVPSKNYDGTTEGAGLAVVSVWTASSQYKQRVTLPAGTYTITVPVYNAGGGTAIEKNLIGFVTDTGAEYYVTNKTYTLDRWKNESVKFTLSKETTGSISIGYVGKDAGSDSAPHLVYDYMTISDGTNTYPLDVLQGDVNEDGKVDMSDAVELISKCVSGATSTLDANVCDLDGNGIINITDALMIVDLYLKR